MLFSNNLRRLGKKNLLTLKTGSSRTKSESSDTRVEEPRPVEYAEMFLSRLLKQILLEWIFQPLWLNRLIGSPLLHLLQVHCCSPFYSSSLTTETVTGSWLHLETIQTSARKTQRFYILQTTLLRPNSTANPL